jgi:hypothetical protein
MAIVIIQDEFDTSLPLVFRWNLAVADTLNEFVLPEYVKKLSLRFETNAGFFTFDGTDGDVSPTHHGSVDADAWLEVNLALRSIKNTAITSIFLAADTNDTVVQILLEA